MYSSIGEPHKPVTQQFLEIKPLKDEDIKFLKKKVYFGYRVWLIFSLVSIVFPFFMIYSIFTSDIEDKKFPILVVIVIFGFWPYVTITGLKDIRRQQKNLLFQKKIEGNIEVLKKEIITIEGHDSDTLSYELKIYSEIEEKYKNISIRQKYYDKIQVGNFIWIEYFIDSNDIKTLIFEEQNIKSKYFR
jgi:hypothetical protein